MVIPHHRQRRHDTVIYEGLIFGLGFLVAGLLALVVLPAVWRRAIRLSTRRLEMQLPLSMTEIIAERDQMRAEFAVTQRRIEQNSEHLTQTLAEVQMELGRRATQIADLESKLRRAQAEIDLLNQELGSSQRAIDETRAELVATSKEQYDASGRLDDTQGKLRELEVAHRGLNEVADERRGTIAALETRISGLELRIEDLRRELGEAGRTIERKNRDLLSLTEERDITKAELGVAQIRVENQQSQIASHSEQIALLTEEARQLRETNALMNRQHGEKLAAIAGYESTLIGNARLTEEAQVRLERARQQAQDVEQRFSQRLETLRQEKAAIAGALEAARNERDKLKHELTSRRPADHKSASLPEADFALLRSAISTLAADVLRLADGQALPFQVNEIVEDDRPTGAKALTKPDAVPEQKPLPEEIG
jgi:chromosome segregation ATPase